MIEDEIIITITDVRRAGFCANGIYALAKQKGWGRSEFKKFIDEGATVAELRALGENALLDRVIEVKRRSTNG